MYMRDLLKCQLLHIHAVSKYFEARFRRVKYLSEIRDVFAVIDVNFTTQRVFDWHRENVTQFFALFD